MNGFYRSLYKITLTMDLLYLICFLLTQNVLAQLGHSSSLLLLTPSTPSIQHFVNDSFIIFCKTVQKDISIKWKDPRGTARENTKGRVHIEKKSGLLALVFEHIALADKGNWTCEAQITADQQSAIATTQEDKQKSFELLVNQKISFDNTEMVQSARESRDATVYCLVKGDPAPDISWLYNGEYITAANSTKYKKLSDGLFIKNVAQGDAGEYTCRAMRITPTFSDSDQITILLRIQHKPQWFYNETNLERFAYINGTVNISCDALGEPPPSFTWIHEGRAILGPHYRIFYADYGSTLQIHVRNESQLGNYKCKVANDLGTLERIIKLRKGQKPVSPSRFQLKRLHASGFELDIRTVKFSNVDENMHVYGYRVEYMSEGNFKYSAGNWSYAKYKEFPFQRGRFKIFDLESNTTYLVRAASRNLAGLSDWSAIKRFATLSNLGHKLFQHHITWHTCFIILIGLIIKKLFPINLN